jgi:hypothetical protein
VWRKTNYSRRHVKIVQSACLIPWSFALQQVSRTPKHSVLLHLPHSIDAWIISVDLDAHLKLRVFCLCPRLIHLRMLTWLWQGIQYVWIVISRLYLHSSLWQQNEDPLWRVVLHQNEITASHFVAESLMQFSRPIVVTEPPHRRALAITDSYMFLFPEFLF